MSENLTGRSLVKRSPNHVATDMAGETVVLDMKSGMYYGMDGVAGVIWNLLEQPRMLSDLQAAVVAEYDVLGLGAFRHRFFHELGNKDLVVRRKHIRVLSLLTKPGILAVFPDGLPIETVLFRKTRSRISFAY